MKLATIKDGTRDGQLAVVARDLKSAHLADGIAPTLQAALDDWAFIWPQLNALYQQLNAGRSHRPFDFNPTNCMAPLPRAFQALNGSAYLNHAALVYKAQIGADRSAASGLLMYQGGSDDFLGPCDAIELAHEEWGIDFEAGIAVIVDDVPMGSTPDQALKHIKLLMLVNDVSLRHLMVDEFSCGYLHSKPASAYSPVAVTPDELDDAWKSGKVHLPLRSTLNGRQVGLVHAGVDMAFNFPQLLSHLAKSRNARAGAIVGSGSVSNQNGACGYSCIVEKRARETIATGAALTPYMQFGDTIRIDMAAASGKSIFGAIEQSVKKSVNQSAA